MTAIGGSFDPSSMPARSDGICVRAMNGENICAPIRMRNTIAVTRTVSSSASRMVWVSCASAWSGPALCRMQRQAANHTGEKQSADGRRGEQRVDDEAGRGGNEYAQRPAGCDAAGRKAGVVPVALHLRQRDFADSDGGG